MEPALHPLIGKRATARALLVGNRIETAGLERSDVLSTLPLSFRAGGNGVAILFRYGVVVLIGLSPLEEDEVLRGLAPRIRGELARREEEAAIVELAAEGGEDQIPPGGPIYVKAMSVERLLVIADALSCKMVLDGGRLASRQPAQEPPQLRPEDNILTIAGRQAWHRKQEKEAAGW